MQAVNQLSRPSGKIRSNSDYKLRKSAQPARSESVRHRYILALLVYLMLAAVTLSMSYFDSGFLLSETITALAVIGLLLALRLFSTEADGRSSEPKAEKVN